MGQAHTDEKRTGKVEGVIGAVKAMYAESQKPKKEPAKEPAKETTPKPDWSSSVRGVDKQYK